MSHRGVHCLAMKDFRDLKVWGKAYQLALDCYGLTSNFRRARYSALFPKSGVVLHQSGQISRKDVAGGVMPIFSVFCTWRWARPVSLNIISFFREIFSSSKAETMTVSTVAS